MSEGLYTRRGMGEVRFISQHERMEARLKELERGRSITARTVLILSAAMFAWSLAMLAYAVGMVMGP